ncbi:aminotransferase class V-fold PLP-dependent enzyme [Shewanella intestini]|uniref:Cysteine desulfurase n=1 Tax=Shewanella intestini TaxID=2017544 RepID=A0ABS5I1S7_9GAMM|nr:MULTISPECIES: SufS family cysteine desulfurase [Shewanella]MBR9727981.1 SufS family cysteine desulfurase [Shewanella intestini]MRG36468.1 SufS family cysteine desulfurase [Shewanella sp. XMDDZSB0408]
MTNTPNTQPSKALNQPFDHRAIREQFPLLSQAHQPSICYLDTAATSQKPHSVIEAMNHYYQQGNANVHRGAYQLSAQATRDYEAVRDKVQQFIHANNRQQIIFTHGTTSAINMVAHGLTEQLNCNDIILIDGAAHHANIVPWQALAKRTGAKVMPIKLTSNGLIDQSDYDAKLAMQPKVVALAHVTNALGTVNPVQQMVSKAKAKGAITLVDGAQAIAHIAVNVAQIDCDFYAFSGHKMYGPTGVGVLYGKLAALEQLTPMLTGGEMIKTVSFQHTTYGELPNRLEAGTPPIAEVIGLGAAIDFIRSQDSEHIKHHEQQLVCYLQQQLSLLSNIELYGVELTDINSTAMPNNSRHNIGAVAFNIKGEHHQDVGILLDQQGIAVRCGHHCAMPLMTHLGLKGCCRASVGMYSNHDDIDRFITALKEVINILV